MTDGEILFPPAVLGVIFSFPGEYNFTENVRK